VSELQPQRSQSTSDNSPVIALANETGTSVDIVKSLYDEEVAALKAGATVTAFIGVIATQRVKRHLNALRAQRADHAPRAVRSSARESRTRIDA
jgi:Protein of unknown function (DUF3562)